MRPGVYSNYTISSNYATPRSAKRAVLYIALSNYFNDMKPMTFNTTPRVSQILGRSAEDKVAMLCCIMFLQAGVTEVVVVKKTSNIAADIEAIARLDNIGVIVADTRDDECSLVLESVISSSDNHKERICIFPASSVAKAVSTAALLDNPRAIVVYSGAEFMGVESQLFTPCALGSGVLTAGRPTINFNAMEFALLSKAKVVSEEDVQLLIKAGVTVFENVGSSVECIRGVTTKTTTDGVPDYSMRSINTVLIIDEVMSSLHSGLRAKLKGGGIFSVSLDSIASQAIVELDEKRREGLISSFEAPRVYPSGADPSVCIIELAFRVAHVIDQIHITAHIEI